MFKMLIGNILFIGVLAGWYFYADGNRDLLLPGVILAFAAFICGIIMGYILHTPRKRRAVPSAGWTAPAYIAPSPSKSPAVAAHQDNDEPIAADVPPLTLDLPPEPVAAGLPPVHPEIAPAPSDPAVSGKLLAFIEEAALAENPSSPTPVADS
jgi:hypothetical protein